MATSKNKEQLQIQENKLVVLGWDGATWDLLTPWLEAGELPHLAELMDKGSHGSIKSTILPLSPAAWSTIVTGQNPGKHAIFDWFERKADSYEVEYVHTGRIAVKTIWQYINEAGKRIGVFSLPMIYPAVSVDGFMVSGMAAPSASVENFAYPDTLIAELEANVGPYKFTEDEVYQYGREEEYLKSLLEWLEYQNKVVHYLIDHKACDVYLFVFMQSDHAQHKLMRYLDPSFPEYNPNYDAQFQDALLRVYRTMDEALGDLMCSLGDETNIILMSDHGAGPCHGIMYVNRWLLEEGLLTIKDNLKTKFKTWLAKQDLVLRVYRLISRVGLGWVANLVSKSARNRVLSVFLSFDDVDWTNTKAYSRGAFGQIFINLENREPQGIVKPGEEYEQVLSEIIQQLSNLKHPDTGEHLITDIRRRENVLNGPYVEKAADIMFSIQDYIYQTSVKFGVESEGLLGNSEYEDSGTHRPEGILVLAGPGIKHGEGIQGAKVEDITPTMLALADVPVPNNLDGRILEEALTEDLKNRIQRYTINEDEVGLHDQSRGLGVEDKDQLEERLRNLGYLG